LTDVQNVGSIFCNNYNYLKKSPFTIAELKYKLDNVVIFLYENMQKKYDMAEPDYMKRQVIRNAESRGFMSLLMKFFKDMSKEKAKYFKNNGVFLHI